MSIFKVVHWHMWNNQLDRSFWDGGSNCYCRFMAWFIMEPQTTIHCIWYRIPKWRRTWGDSNQDFSIYFHVSSFFRLNRAVGPCFLCADSVFLFLLCSIEMKLKRQCLMKKRMKRLLKWENCSEKHTSVFCKFVQRHELLAF